MKTFIRILAAFLTFLVSFSPIESLEKEACFTLAVHFWSSGDMYYWWPQSPVRTAITLACPANMYVNVNSAVKYAIPKFYDKYCLQNNRQVNYNVASGCTYASPCGCCHKPRTEDELCYYSKPSTQVLAAFEKESCRQNDICTVNVQRTEIPSSTNPQCQDYACRDADTSTAGGEYSRCYSRWVTVSYHCTSTPPPNTPRPPAPTTMSTTSTLRPTTTTSTTTTTPQTTSTTTSTSTIPPMPSGTTSTTLITTLGSQSSRTSANPDSHTSQPAWASTTLTKTDVDSTQPTTEDKNSGINTGLVAGLCVCLLIILIGLGAGIIMLFLYRKRQKTPYKNSAAGSVYYNVSPGTIAQPGHNMAPKIPQRKPQADNTDTYEEVTVKNNAESLTHDVTQGDYYNITGVNAGSKVEGSVYEMPVRDRNEIRESSNTGNMYQQLDNTANGTIADTTAAVDYENLAISSDYITVD